MKTIIEIPVRQYTVNIKDERTGAVSVDQIVLDKATLQAAQVVGLMDKAIIERRYNKKGYFVLDIGKPRKVTLKLPLEDILAVQDDMELELEQRKGDPFNGENI